MEHLMKWELINWSLSDLIPNQDYSYMNNARALKIAVPLLLLYSSLAGFILLKKIIKEKCSCEHETKLFTITLCSSTIYKLKPFDVLARYDVKLQVVDLHSQLGLGRLS